jgi:uncharacterized protein YegP (UPF0339 family)
MAPDSQHGPDPEVDGDVVVLDETDTDPESGTRFELYRDEADQWRWRLVHRNGNIVADSGEGYARKAGAKNGIESVKRNAQAADVVLTEE